MGHPRVTTIPVEVRSGCKKGLSRSVAQNIVVNGLPSIETWILPGCSEKVTGPAAKQAAARAASRTKDIARFMLVVWNSILCCHHSRMLGGDQRHAQDECVRFLWQVKADRLAEYKERHKSGPLPAGDAGRSQ